MGVLGVPVVLPRKPIPVEPGKKRIELRTLCHHNEPFVIVR